MASSHTVRTFGHPLDRLVLLALARRPDRRGRSAACSGDDDAAPVRRPSAHAARADDHHPPTTTTHADHRPPTRARRPARFTITGSRAGFAHGYELVRRESPADVEADLDLMAVDRRAVAAGRALGGATSSAVPGVYDWAAPTGVVLGARSAGCRSSSSSRSAPRWDSAPGCRQFECAPDDPGPYASFVRVAAQRYAPLGVHHWEIWNEPNHVPFWGPRPDPVAYTELLRRVVARAPRGRPEPRP